MSAIVAIQSANLVADPIVKYTTTGKAVANFRIAVNEGFGDTKKSYFFNAVAWEELAGEIGKLAKGAKLGIYGKLTSREYEKDGQKRTVIEIVANALDIRKADSRSSSGTGQGLVQGRPQQAQQIDDSDIPF